MTTPDLDLVEYTPTSGVTLSGEEATALQDLAGVAVLPTVTPGVFDLSPGSSVGVLQVGERRIALRPKVPMDRVLFLLSYALDPARWQDVMTSYGTEADLADTMAGALASAIHQAIRRGVLQGYRSVEETAPTIRGRIRFDEQLRRHHDRSFPVEIAYDDFTIDIDENRILLGALWRVRRLPLRSQTLRNQLARLWSSLADGVALVPYPGGQIPEIMWTRLNQRYRPAVSLARLVLESTTIEQDRSGAGAAGLLVDMNEAFERFVRTALREALGLSERAFPSGKRTPPLHLDRAGRVRLDPDLSWWHRGRCRFVGDVKYKRLSVSGIKHPDLYQLLAYVVATDLPGGLLVYPVAEKQHEATHGVTHLDRTLHVATIDLTGNPSAILDRVADLAERVQLLTCDGPITRAA